MLGWVSSAMATASSTESTLPKTLDSGLVTGGGGEVARGGVCVGGGAMGACAAALLVTTTRAAPASSNCRAPILLAIALPGPDHALCVASQDRATPPRISRTPRRLRSSASRGAKRRACARWTGGGQGGEARGMAGGLVFS